MSAGIRRYLARIIGALGNRRGSREDGNAVFRFRRRKPPAHALDIRHGAPDAFARQLQPEIVPWLEEDALGAHESLPHGAVGRLTEVAALGVLQMRPSRGERDLHIGDRRAGQHAAVLFFRKMRQYKALPVEIEFIG